jgi:hypothetical protein
MKIATRILLAAVVVASMSTTGCKNDDDDDDNVIPNTSRTLALEVEAHWGANSFDINSTYMDDYGTMIKFTDIRMYLSNMKAMDMAGNMTGDFPDAILYDAAQGPMNHTLGTVSAMHVHMVNAHVGLDSITNHQDPMLAQPPLNDATMHWGWSPMAGYKFAVIEGVADTDNSGTIDAADQAFIYHLATDALYTPFSMMAHTDINEGETKTLHIEVDVEKIIDGIEVASNLDTHTTNEPALAQQLMSNIAGSIGIQ